MSRRMTKTSDFSDDEILPSTSVVSKSTDKSNPTTNSGNSMAFSLQKSFEANAFKTVNGQFQLQGRHGIAILATPDKSLYKLLIYAAGNTVISQAILTHNFQLTMSNKLYASFYDSYNLGWSLLFDNEERLIDFARYITLVKFTLGKYSTVAWCDFIPGDGDKVEMGDSIEIRFTGYILQDNGSLGNVFETNKASNTKPMRIKLGKSKAIDGWNEGLIGIQKGTHRMLIIPFNKAYGSKGLQPKVPPNSNLYFDVEAIRIRSRRESNVESTSLKVEHSLSMSLKTESGDDDDIALPSIPIVSTEKRKPDVKQRGHSLSQKSDQKGGKQAILSRMARMGQAMLPPSGGGGKDSDSEADSDKISDISDSVVQMSAYQPIAETSNRVQPIPVIPNVQPPMVNPKGFVPQPVSQQQEVMYQQQLFPSQTIYQVGSQPSNQIATYTPIRMPQVQNAQPLGTPSAYMQQPQGPSQIEQQPQMNYHQQQQLEKQPNKTEKDLPDLHSAMLVNETRQQNTEMRISIGKLQDRLDDVLTIVREMKINEKNSSNLFPAVPTMETSVLLQNLTRIIKENEHLKNEVFQRSEKIESQSKKISDLLAKNQTFMEENNQNFEKNALTFHNNASSTHQKILSLEEQKLKLVQELSARTSEIYELQIALDKARKDVSESNHNLSESIDKRDVLQKSVDALKIGNKDLEDRIDSLKSYNKNMKETIRSLEQKFENLEEKNKELQQEHVSGHKSIKEKVTKLEDEKRELTHQFDREKGELSREIDELREKLRQERAAVYSDVSLKQNQIEEEITARWKKRCDQLVRAEVERFERQIAELNEDKERIETDYNAALKKLTNFKNQTREMKQNLLDDIQKITSENEALTDKVDELESIKQKSKEIVAKTEEDLNLKIKSIMNAVFHSIKNKIHADRKYDGSKIHSVAMEIIKKSTLSLTAEVSDEESEEEDEDDSEEEEEDEEQNDSESEDTSSESIPNDKTETTDSIRRLGDFQDAYVNDANKEFGNRINEKLKCAIEINRNNEMTGNEISSPDNTSDLISTMHEEFLEPDHFSDHEETLSSIENPTKELENDQAAKEPEETPDCIDQNIKETNETVSLVNESEKSNDADVVKQDELSVENVEIAIKDNFENLDAESSQISGYEKTKSVDELKNVEENSNPDQGPKAEYTETRQPTDEDGQPNLLSKESASSVSSEIRDNELLDSTATTSAKAVQENISCSESSKVNQEDSTNAKNSHESSTLKPKSNDAFSSLFSDDEDNEPDGIFAIEKKEPKKEHIETAQVKIPVKSLFGDDDDIGWLNS